MNIRFVNVGMRHMVQVNKVVAILTPQTVVAKRMINEAKANNKYIDASLGRSFRSVLVLEEGFVIVSCINPETLRGRFNSSCMDRAEEAYEDEGLIEPEDTEL